ncbi:MAG: helix-turn-helix transcriptional regulator [Ruminococcaceae bacterium]|nr:helix-turn-helix transcriptional regulator [Oscillospiraceae bacterium]
MSTRFPVIDPVATGENIVRLQSERGLSVRDLQEYFGFEEPRAIYKWQRGQTLPSVDNLFALGALLQVSLDEILIPATPHLNIVSSERQAEACRSAALTGSLRYDRSPSVHQPFFLPACA